MISWIQTILQKHNKWLFGILLAVIIVAFVFTIGATPGIGSGDRGAMERNFYGYNIASRPTMEYLQRGTVLSFDLEQRRPSEAEFESALYQRGVRLHLADIMEIPLPDEAQLAVYLQTLPRFEDPATGTFSSSMYTEFLDDVYNSPVYNDANVTEIIAQNWRLQQVDQALAGPGYVQPEMIKRLNDIYNTQWSVEVASMPYDTFEHEIEPSEEDIAGFFEQYGSRYLLPPEQTFQYIFFSAKDFVDQAADPTEEKVQAYYVKNLSKWPRDEEGQTMPLTLIRPAVTASLKEEQATRLAAETASDFSYAIYEAQLEKQIENTEAEILSFAASQGYTVETTAAFSGQTPTDKLPLPSEVIRTGLTELTANTYYTDAIPVDDGAYVLFPGTTTEARQPPLETVREQVVLDYQDFSKNQAFTAFGLEAKTQLMEALAAGKPFAEAAEKLGFTAAAYSDFTILTIPPALTDTDASQLMEMEPGEVSNMVRDRFRAGTIFYLKSKDLQEQSDSATLAQAERTLKFQSARATEFGILNDLVETGLKEAVPEEF